MKNQLIIFLFILSNNLLFSQNIDRIDAIIGSEILLTSDIENQYNQVLSQGVIQTSNVKCDILDELLYQNLLIHHAKIDSTIEISEDEVSQEVNKRITFFESQLGSLNKVEDYFKRSVDNMKQELSIVVKDQLYTQKKQNIIISNVKITPNEVKDYLSSIEIDDIPLIPTQLELSQLVILPKLSFEKKKSIKDKLDDFRKRILSGEDFKVLATLYSDDVASANNGGELGFMSRGELLPEFERAAFKLQNNEISEVVETKFGFHLIQMIDRRGEQINARHILIKPKFTSSSIKLASDEISLIKLDIDSGLISFDDAVVRYSHDKSKNNGGLIINPNSGSTNFTYDDLDPSIKYIVQNMSIGEVTTPSLTKSNDGSQAAYRLIRLNNLIVEHKANISNDFDVLKEYALVDKKQRYIDKWIIDNINDTYIQINEDFSHCSCYNKWIK
tara:strand:+ start:322 stop:1653 length:1332 start_codon:yes stop_codon:yes gene_type:complete